jgi:2-polyprenyl-3-methyl-5-hydroxy-6-metoxy-1,4-benzoquinol methylase
MTISTLTSSVSRTTLASANESPPCRAEYDRFSRAYQRSKQLPFRIFSETPDHMALLGDVRGRSVLDLACGEGFYTRRIKRAGAARVEGVDLSAAMIELAREQEADEPLGILYHITPAENFATDQPFDIVSAAFLLNCAADREQLDAMARVIAVSLRPGGRFVTTNSNLCAFPLADYRPYRMQCDIPALLGDGDAYHITFLLDEDSFTIVNYAFETETYEKALRDAGLTDICWHTPTITADGLAAFGTDFWHTYLSQPPLLRLSAQKPLI